MKNKPARFSQDDPDSAAPYGLYDGPEDEAKDDLWFLPEVDDSEADPLSSWMPGDKAPDDPIALWREAGHELSEDLAELSLDQGRLFERLRHMGQGAVARLAYAEAASLSWWIGDRISADRLALWLSFRIGATGDDSQGLARSAWAVRMLQAPRGREAPAAHIGSEPIETLLGDIFAAYPGANRLHPVLRGAFLFQHWRGLEERHEHLRDIEAAVLAARFSVGPERELPFMPLSLTGFGALTVSGTPLQRLTGWLNGAHQAILSALLSLDRLQNWQKRAEESISDLSGRTPMLLVKCLLQYPVVAAPLAEQETGASRAAVQRNLDILMDRGLIREITGQGRFRLWTAAS